MEPPLQLSTYSQWVRKTINFNSQSKDTAGTLFLANITRKLFSKILRIELTAIWAYTFREISSNLMINRPALVELLPLLKNPKTRLSIPSALIIIKALVVLLKLKWLGRLLQPIF
jgi:hypothetical protein